jgi:ATP-dependent helicase IRC3
VRDYQKECIQTIENVFKERDRQFIQLPTGSGKTWIFCEYLSKNSDRALIICPSIELREQILTICKKFNISSVSKDLNKETKNHVITSMSLCFDKNLDKINDHKYDHIVIDEAHHAQCETYKKFLENLDFSCKILGCTATPERLDGKSLLDIFEILSFERNIYQLIVDGFLSDIEAYRIKTNQKISKRGIDFKSVELKELDNESRNKIILETYFENCVNKKTLIFCLNIEHCIRINDLLKLEGIKSAYIHGKMNIKSRKEILKKYKTGEIEVLTNCQLLTEGFDEPSIEAIIITRPTASKSLYCQMLGRGLRKFEGKEVCYLYELTDNNHNICTFNVACGKEPQFQIDYANKTRLTELYKEIEKINLEDFKISTEKIELFTNQNKLAGNSIQLINSYFYDILATQDQLDYLAKNGILKRENIQFPNEINFLEAAFLIWKEKIKRKHGINY